MTNQLVVDNNSSSISSGIYVTNSLFKRFKSQADLQPEDGMLYPLAIPTHVHEFIHYLHNISTTSGVRATLLSNIAVFMASQLLEFDHSIKTSSDNSDQSQNIRYFIDQLNFIYGDSKEDSEPFTPTQNGWNFSNLQTYKQDIIKNSFAYQITAKCNISKFIKKFVIKIGLNFITEGVAYEIEREIWREKGTPPIVIDARTPPFPYLAYEPLVNYLTGRQTTPLERIKIGNAALMHISPSQGLVDACVSLRKNSALFEHYCGKAINNFRKFIGADFDSLAKKLEEFYKNTDKLLPAFHYYISIIKNTSLKRIANPNIEICFLGADISVEEFLLKSSYIAEHCIIQEKQDKSTQIDIIANSSNTELCDNDITWFYVFCSAIHFIQQHFRKDGVITKTEDIQEKQCPFTGGCEVERLEGNPESCKRFPWNFTPKQTNGTCWYFAGIQSITPIKKFSTPIINLADKGF